VPERDKKSLITFAVSDVTRALRPLFKAYPIERCGRNRPTLDCFSNLPPPATTPQSHHGCRSFRP